MTDKTAPKPETPEEKPAAAPEEREATVEELGAMLDDAEDDVDTAEARVAALEAERSAGIARSSLRDVVRSQAFAMLAADTEEGMFAASMVVPFMLTAREFKAGFASGMKGSGLDLADVLDSPAIQSLIASITGTPQSEATPAAPASPAAPTSPNLIVKGDPGTHIVVFVQNTAEVAALRIIPPTGTRAIALPPGIYKVGAFPSPERSDEVSMEYVDLVDPDEVVTVFASAAAKSAPADPAKPKSAPKRPAPKAKKAA